MGIYKVLSYIWLDGINKCYKKILVVNNKPENSAFKNIIKTFPIKRKSPYDDIYCCDGPPHCVHGILNPKNKREFLGVNDVDILFTFLVENNFKLEETLTDILMKNKIYHHHLVMVFSDN